MALTVSVVTPERLLQQSEADAVFVPAWDGELGILNNHLPLLAQLKPGEVRIESAEKSESFSISGGFLEVRKNNVFIFAETAESVAEIDLERARQAAERAREQLRSRSPEVELTGAESALRRALIRIHVAESARRRERRPPPR